MKYWLLVATLFVSSNVLAQVELVSGKVALMRAHNDTVGSEGSFTLVQLEGVTNVMDCTQAQLGKGNLTHLVVANDETNIYSMLLAAHMSGRSVQIHVDSTTSSKINGLCVVRYASVF